MRALLALPLVLLSLLAGCLEASPPSDPSPGAGSAPGTDDTGLPPLPGRLLYERTHAFVAPRVDEVAVPEDATALHVQIALAVPTLADAASAVSVAVDAPDGTRVAECIDGTCSTSVERPANGTWRVVYEGTAARTANVTLRVEGATPPLPTPPTSRPPTPEPPTLTPRVWDAYARTYDFGAFRYVPFENDTFGLPRGLDALMVEIRFDGAGDATVRLLDPTGEEKGLCRADGATCGLEVPAPLAGLWQVEYEGKDAAVKADVRAAAASAASGEMPPALHVFRQVHPYASEHPWNRTSSFWVPEGYARVNLSVFFSRTHAPGPGDTPVVQLRSPDAAVVVDCRAAPGVSTCDVGAEARPGLWTVWYFGPATGAARADVFAVQRELLPSPPSPAQPAPGEDMLHRDLRHGRDTATFDVDPDVAALRLLVESNGTISGRVQVRAPGDAFVLTCAAPCHVHVGSPRPGGWTIHYSPEVGEDVGTSAYATPRR